MKPAILGILLLLLAGCAGSKASKAHGAKPADPAGTSEQDDANTIDTRIALHVRKALLDDRSIGPDAGAIVVSTLEGVVTLTGYVRDDARKQRATVVANAVGSVVRIDNRLVVDPEAVKTPAPVESTVDRLLSDRVRQALQDERTIAAECRTVRVLTQDGVVRLSGTVGSEAVKARAGTVASAVGSVKRVVNELVVKAR